VKNLPGIITYTLNVIDANNCPSLVPDQVIITVTKEGKVYAGVDTTVATFQPVPLQALDMNGSGLTQFEWIPHDYLDDPFSPSPISTPARNMWYTVIARTANGCIAQDDIKITVYNGPEIYVPKAFTPDGNGINDILKAVPAGMREFHYFNIYNRWGKLMFSTTDPNRGWDGKLNGNIQSSDTYIWMAEGIDYNGKIVYRKGTVIIIH
jgi:gliding motility-associated-like protein